MIAMDVEIIDQGLPAANAKSPPMGTDRCFQMRYLVGELQETQAFLHRRELALAVFYYARAALMNESAEYEILVAGQIGPQWADWFAEMAVMAQADETTRLCGSLPDQAALHGVLAKIRDVGLPLLGVRRLTRVTQNCCQTSFGDTRPPIENSGGPQR